MSDYKKMCHSLLAEISDTIDRLKEKLLEVEEIGIETDLKEVLMEEKHKHTDTPIDYLVFDHNKNGNQ